MGSEVKYGVPLTGGSSANGHHVEVVAQETSYSVENNTSTVSIINRLVHVSGTPGSFGSGLSWSVNRQGQGAAASGSAAYDFRNNLFGWKDLGATTITVAHNADGTGSVNVQASISSGHLGSGTATVTVPLTTIPRASTASFSGGSTFDAGAPVTIDTNRASSGFTHNIHWYFGTESGVVATGVGASYAWTPNLSMLAQIPDATIGNGHIRVFTYAPGNPNPIGARDTPFNLRAPASAVPTISSLSVSDNNPTVVSIVGLFVQSLSILKATVNAAGVHGSTINSRTFSMGGSSAPSGGAIPVNDAGTVALAASCTDSRGRVGTWSGTLSVLAYANPRFTTVLVRRATAAGVVDDNGTSLRVDLNAAVSSLMNGTQRNSMTIRVFTRPRGGSVWTARNVINHSGVTYNSNFVVSGGANYPVDDSFDVRVDVVDKFNTSSAQTVIATAKVFMHWSKTGVAVGKYHERGAFEVEGDAYVTRDMFVERNLVVNGSMTSGSVPNARLTELSAGLALASAAAVAPGNNLNNAIDSGFYQSTSSTANRPPGNTSHQILVINGGGRSTQYASLMSGAGVLYKRWREPANGTAWTAWLAVGDERDSGWVTPGTGSGWGAYAGENVRYRAKNGFVHLSGRVTGTTAAGTLIFTLPTAYRHNAPEPMVFNTHSDDGTTIILVGSDGKVNIASRAGLHRQGVSLAGISFPIA